MANQRSTRGGRRTGSGRRQAGPEPLTVKINVALSVSVADRIEKRLEAGRGAAPEATWTPAAFVRAAIEEKLGREGG